MSKCVMGPLGTLKDNKNSVLNEKLMKRFPYSDNGKGVSVYYEGLFDPVFVDFFGQWFIDEDIPGSEEAANKLYNDPKNHMIFNTQGEPRLIDNGGDVYFVKADQTRYVIKKNALSQKDKIETINSITLKLIMSPEKDIKSSVTKFLTSRLDAINERILDLEDEIEALEDQIDYSKTTKKQEAINESLEEQIDNIRVNDIFPLEDSRQAIENSILKEEEVLNGIIEGIKVNLANYNLKYVDEVASKEDDDPNTNSDINNNTKETSETRDSNNIDSEIKAIMASLEKYDEKINGEESLILSRIMQMPMSRSANSVKNRLIQILSNIIETNLIGTDVINDPYDLMMDKLQQFQDENKDSITRDFISRVNDLYEEKSPLDKEAFKTKFVKSFYLAQNAFTITELSEKDGKLRLRHIDPTNTQDKESVIANEMIRSLLNKFFFDSKKGKISNEKDFDKAAELLRKSKNKEDIYSGLKMLGLNVETKTINKLFEKRDNIMKGISSEKVTLKDFFKELFNQEISFRDSDDNIVKSIGLKSILEAYAKSDSSTQNNILSALRDKDLHPPFNVLARYEGVNKVDISDSSLFVGSKQRWMYSLITDMNKRILTWQSGNLSSLKLIEHKNLEFVDYLLAKDLIKLGVSDKSEQYEKEVSKRIGKLKLIINSEIKKVNDSSPVLHKEIGEADMHLDIFFKMFDDLSEDYEKQEQQQNSKKKLKFKENTKVINSMPILSADKSTSYGIYGFLAMSNKTEVNEKGELISLGNNNKERISQYLLGEYNTLSKNSTLVKEYLDKKTKEEKQEYLMTRLIPDYHYSLKVNTDKGSIVYNPENRTTTESFNEEDKEDVVETNKDLDFRFFNAGSWNKLGFFNSSMNKNEEAFSILFTYEDGVKIANPNGHSAINSLSLLVADEIMEIAIKNKAELDAIEIESGVSVLNKQTNIIGSTEARMHFDYIINSMFSNIELYNMFNGELAFYKQKGSIISMEDALKRGPAAITDGLYPRITGKPIIKTYTTFSGKKVEVDKDRHMVIAVINNIDIDNSVHSALINKGLENKEEDLIDYDYELADAQGFGTPELHKLMVSKIYGWQDSDEVTHNNLLNKNHKLTSQDVKWLKKAGNSNQPGKFVGYDQIPYQNEAGDDIGQFADYLKFSVAYLYPAVVAGTDMEKLANKMTEKGIDVVLSKSGSKGSNRQSTEIHKMKDGIFDGLKDDMNFNPYTFNLSAIKLQVELPTKFDHEGVLGNQHLKNLLGNINMLSESKDYVYRGKSYTGKQMHDIYTGQVIRILQNQLNAAMSKLDIKKEGEKYTFSQKKLRDLIISQLDINTDYDLINIIKDDSLPLETIPGIAQRAYPIINSFIHKNYGKVLTNAGSVIQIANMGFDRISDEDSNQVIYLSKDKELRPPLPATVSDLTKEELESLSPEDALKTDQIVYFDENGLVSLNRKDGKMRIQKARIMLPFTSIYDKTGLSYEEFKNLINKKDKNGKDIIDMEIFSRIVGYRIPNQSISSNDAIEIVGILPPSAGDSAIVFHEITAKTGSDFDIDKMYLMMPNFTAERDWVVSEENQTLIGLLKNEKIRVKPLSEYMTYKFKDGQQIVDFIEQDEDIKKILKESRKKNESKYYGPIKEVLQSKEEILEYLKNTDSFVDFAGETISIKAIILDLFNAHQTQVQELKEEVDSLGQTNKDKIKAIYKEFGFLGDVKSVQYIRDNSPKGEQNALIEIMQSIMQAEATYDDLMSKLDNPLIKDGIDELLYIKSLVKEENAETKISDFKKLDAKSKKKIFKKFTESKKLSPLEQMAPTGAVNARVDMLKAKKLVATMANHMTDIPMSQIVEQVLKYDLKIGSNRFDGIFVKSKEGSNKYEGDNKFKLTKIVSYLMNAAVDAAKDNYIIQGNFNSYTANGAMVMIRLGIDPINVFKVLMNDDILKISKYKQLQSQKVTDLNNPTYSQPSLNLMSEAFLLKISEQEGPMDFDSFIENKDNDTEMILGFWNIIQLAGKEMNNDIVSSKADSNGAGRTIYENHALMNRLSRLMQESIGSEVNENFVRGLKLFKEGITPEKLNFTNDLIGSDLTFLGAMMNNSLFLTNMVTKSMFLENTDTYRQIVNRVSNQLGNVLPTDVDSIKTISSYLYPYILTQSGHELYKISDKEELTNRGGKMSEVDYLQNEFPSEVLDMKTLNPNNAFFRELYIDMNTNLVSFPNFKYFDPNDKVVIREDLESVYRQLDTKGNPSGAIFMNKLVKYAFLTTGFKPTFFAMNEYLPKTFFLDTGHGQKIQDLINALNEGLFIDNTDIAQIITFMAINNEDNFNIVKSLKMIRSGGYNGPAVYSNPVSTGKPVKKLETRAKLTIEGTSNFMPFVKIKGGKGAFMLVDTVDGDIDGIPTKMPIYHAINTNSIEVDSESNKTAKYKRKVKLFDMNGIKKSKLFKFESDYNKVLVQKEIEYISALGKLFRGNNLMVNKDSISLQKINEMERYNSGNIEEVNNFYGENKEVLTDNSISKEMVDQMVEEHGPEYTMKFLAKCKLGK